MLCQKKCHVTLFMILYDSVIYLDLQTSFHIIHSITSHGTSSNKRRQCYKTLAALTGVIRKNNWKATPVDLWEITNYIIIIRDFYGKGLSLPTIGWEGSLCGRVLIRQLLLLMSDQSKLPTGAFKASGSPKGERHIRFWPEPHVTDGERKGKKKWICLHSCYWMPAYKWKAPVWKWMLPLGERFYEGLDSGPLN